MFLKVLLPWIFSAIMFLSFLFFLRNNMKLREITKKCILSGKEDEKIIRNLRLQIMEYDTLVTVCKDLDRRKQGISKDLKFVSKEEYNEQIKFLPRRTRSLM